MSLDSSHVGQVPNGEQLFFRWCFGVDEAEDAVRLTQEVEFVAHEEPTVLYDADGVGDGFYVGEEVGGEETYFLRRPRRDRTLR